MPDAYATVPRLAGLPELLAHHARHSPGREAACDERLSLTYAELDLVVGEFARGLLGQGLRAGDRVAFQGPPGLPFWVSLLGTQRAGAAWVGLNPGHTARELAHVLRDAQPALTLSALDGGSPGFIALGQACEDAGMPGPERMEGVRLPAASVAGAAWPGWRQVPPVAVPGDVALVVYTSGTTGAPKGALLSASGLVENGWWLASRMRFAPLRGLVNLPVNHIGCVGDLCATLLVAGGTVVFMERFDPAEAVRTIRRSGVEWLPQVPAQFQLMAAQGGLDAGALRGVRHLTWGGAAMPSPLARQLREWVPDVFNSYGLTECSGTITVTAPGASLEELTDTVGRPVAPDRLRIADADGVAVPAGEVGEVQISGPHVFRGYLHRPDATARAFTRDGWLRSGDLGSLDPRGNLHLHGRTHEMFKSGGYNVYPREVETVIESMPGVQLCAVVATPDPLWGEVGTAFVQGDPHSLSPERLREHCHALLARYKVPKNFLVRSALPLLPVGKVDKAALRRDAAGHGSD